MYLHKDKEVQMKNHHVPYSCANKSLFSRYSLIAKDKAKAVISMKTNSWERGNVPGALISFGQINYQNFL